MPDRSIRAIVVLLAGFALAWLTADRLPAQDDSENFESLKPKIAALVEQLGADDFAVREQAQTELKRLGVAAFDALRRAQNHDDVEVARRAKYLVRSIQIRWRRADDPPMILNALKEYGDQPAAARSRLLDRLAALPSRSGVPALCRIARFETSDDLARRAALLVASHESPKEDGQREELAETIDAELGVSKRVATGWLRAYVKALRAPQDSVDDWEEIVARAFDRRDRLPSVANDGQVEMLLKIYVDILLQVGRKAEAAENAERILKFVRGRRDTILYAIDWLLERELYAVIEQLVEQYPKQAERFLTIRYRLAESQHRQGKTELAEQSAAAALKANPEAFDVHVRAAIELQQRSLLDWSIRELETVVANAEPNNMHGIHARLLLSEVHHDFERELEAAEVIAPVARQIEEGDKEIRDRVRQPPIGRTGNGIVARMHLFYAMHYRKEGDTKKHLEHLLKGASAEAEDADVLIAMHNAKDGDEEFRKKSDELIDAFLKKAAQQIRDMKDYLGRSPNESTRNDVRNAIAMFHNQYAWLACNTGRDLPQALASSHRSLELRPNTAAYLDTLAHCYAAIDDYKNAVKYQQQAVDLEPYTFQISKKLKIFSEKLAKAEQP